MRDVFEGIHFIKTNAAFEKTYHPKNSAPMFRRSFTLNHAGEATLSICCLGYGKFFINGVESEDLFIAPVSNYGKTLWYTQYDVTHLLNQGVNTFCVWCGNGWYNETMETTWKFSEASWRDVPKFIMRLDVDGETVLTSDESWKCCNESAIYYNNLRSGECFDSRLYDERWTSAEYDATAWSFAIVDDQEPKGVFRRCDCEPIRECTLYPAKKVIQTGEKRYLFDIGQCISGYVRLSVCQKSGDELIIRYAEQIDEELELKLNGMRKYYSDCELMTDHYICNGKPSIWSPRFTYHGFRFIEIDGLDSASLDMVTGVFVHQDIALRSDFSCSNPLLNRLFQMGRMSTYSNLFYMPTDCPTREKMGWTNDAQASADQMLTNFEIERFFEKWNQDLCDAVREDGMMPGIVPSSGWGYEWGNGPVSDGALFEIPYQLYLHTAKPDALIHNYPYFMKYLDMMTRMKDADGNLTMGLHDWIPPGNIAGSKGKIPQAFINAIFEVKFLRITQLAAQLSGRDDTQLKERIVQGIEFVRSRYINAQGRCTINEQTAPAMLIYHRLYENLEPLKEQLRTLIEENMFHNSCGMVGLRHLYIALNMCGLEEYAYRIITSDSYPGYAYWIENGATTLWEKWEPRDSKNHHMFSDFMSWMIKTLLGIAPQKEYPGYEQVQIAPYFPPTLDYAAGSINTVRGEIAVDWKREEKGIALNIRIPEGVCATLRDIDLLSGSHQFMIDAQSLQGGRYARI